MAEHSTETTENSIIINRDGKSIKLKEDKGLVIFQHESEVIFNCKLPENWDTSKSLEFMEKLLKF